MKLFFYKSSWITFRNKLDSYELEIEFTNGSTKLKKIGKHSNSVAKYFDENGKLCTEQFHLDLVKFFASVYEEKKSN